MDEVFRDELGGPHGSNSAAGIANLSNAILRASYRAQLKPMSATNDYAATDFTLCIICHAAAPFADDSKQNRTDTNYRLHGFHLNRLDDDPGGGGAGTINTPGAGRGNPICRECHYDPHGTRGTFHPTNRTNARLVNFAPNITGPGGTGEPSWVPGTCNLRCHGKDHNPRNY